MKFDVEVLRVSYAYNTITVEADTIEQAKERAIDVAGDYLYNEKDSEYSVNSVNSVKVNSKDITNYSLSLLVNNDVEDFPQIITQLKKAFIEVPALLIDYLNPLIIHPKHTFTYNVKEFCELIHLEK